VRPRFTQPLPLFGAMHKLRCACFIARRAAPFLHVSSTSSDKFVDATLTKIFFLHRALTP
jgi:hypothetical protein